MKNKVLRAIMLVLTLSMCFGASVMAKEKDPYYSPEIGGEDDDKDDLSDTDKDPDGSQTSPQTSASAVTYVAMMGLTSLTVVCGLHKKED